MKHRLFRRGLALALSCVISFVLPASAGLFGLGEQKSGSVAALSKNTMFTDPIVFTPEDFQVSGEARLASLIITSLPDSGAGLLTMGSESLSLGSQIDLDTVNTLRFTPLSSPLLSAASFTFSPVFDDGSIGEDVTVDLHLLSAPNEAPVAEDLSLCTYKNVEVQGSFAAVDPEGDLLTFRLLTKPARGSVTQLEDGSAAFTYTPYENKTGKDAFTYVAVDAQGNTSSPATVSVKIEKQKTAVTYSDMTGIEGHREAVRMAESGLLVGERMGSGYFFHPEQAMSRAQFTALAMAAAGIDALEGVTLTGFADDEAMALWAKPYVSAALRAGVVQGSVDELGQVIFQPDAPITAAEAAVVLDRALRVTDVPADVTTMADVPAWCVQSVANLDSCGALPASAVLSEPLTRAQAAVMLSGALDVMEGRDSKGWLFWG